MNLKNVFIKLAAAALASLMLLPLAACSSDDAEVVTDPIFECEDKGISLCFYELLLSRVKGALAKNKYDVNDPEFWATRIEGDGRTYEEFYNEYVLESCKNYFAASLIFEAEGYTLPKSVLDEIDQTIEDYITVGYIGGGSEEKFNAIIDDFGVNADTLRQCYIIEAKYEYVISKLYEGGSLIGDVVKEEYYQANYHRFKQIYLANTYCDFEYDSQGNLFYFSSETGKPLYDKKNGSVRYDSKGNHVKDRFGEPIYFDKDGKIIYDTKNGTPMPVYDSNGNAVTHQYSAEEMAARKAIAESLASELDGMGNDYFESEASRIAKEEMIFEDAYPDGFYLSRTEEGNYVGYDYILKILDALEDMKVGEVRLVESESGYHVVKKYKLDEGKYNDGKYAEWFDNFTQNIINDLFYDRIEKEFSSITVNEVNVAKARSIKDIGVNFNY